MVQLARLAHRQLNHLPGPRRVGEVWFLANGSLAFLHPFLDPVLDRGRIDLEVLQQRQRGVLSLCDQPQQHVLSADVLMAQAQRFLARELQRLSDVIREVVETSAERMATHWKTSRSRENLVSPRVNNIHGGLLCQPLWYKIACALRR